MASGDGEGATEFHDYEGGGVGEGEGSKDVSDKIENEDQVTFVQNVPYFLELPASFHCFCCPV